MVTSHVILLSYFQNISIENIRLCIQCEPLPTSIFELENQVEEDDGDPDWVNKPEPTTWDLDIDCSDNKAS